MLICTSPHTHPPSHHYTHTLHLTTTHTPSISPLHTHPPSHHYTHTLHLTTTHTPSISPLHTHPPSHHYTHTLHLTTTHTPSISPLHTHPPSHHYTHTPSISLHHHYTIQHRKSNTCMTTCSRRRAILNHSKGRWKLFGDNVSIGRRGGINHVGIFKKAFRGTNTFTF